MSFRLVIIKSFVAVVTLYIFKYYEKTLLLSILTVYCFCCNYNIYKKKPNLIV